MKGISRLLCLFALALVAVPLLAESKNVADYPLRLHIFGVTGTTFYHNRYPEETRGDGRANLFENGEPRGLDFSFDCEHKIKPSFGFETYPAKWKKNNEKLTVLFPVFGKSNAYFTCTIDVQMKDYAYVVINGRLTSEPSQQFKAWMIRNDYDPEHGKNTPRRMAAPLDEARLYLTGDHKDTEKARKLLLEIVRAEPRPNALTLVWADIYLGYIEDLAKNRQGAIDWYQKALAVQGAPQGGLEIARSGLQKPLLWIRHLDGPQPPEAR